MSTIALFEEPSILNNLHWNPLVSILYAKSYYFTISCPTSTSVLSLFKIVKITEHASSLVFYSAANLCKN